MFKVLIVDDEIYVVALIEKLINWEKFNMKIEATANDGITALRLVKEIKPDLVIVDIRMPGYDGISFMDKVREFNANVKFIVVSGHKQFDYARGAMRNNAEDYLLKPINKEELEQVLSHVYKQLVEMKEKEYHVKNIEEELDVSRRRVREACLDAIIHQREIPDEVSKINQRFFTEFVNGKFQVLALVADIPASLRGSGDNNFMIEEIKRKLSCALKEVCAEVVFIEKGNMRILLINYHREKEKNIHAVVQSEMTQYIQLFKKFENISLYICYGESCDSISEIDKSVISLWKCIYGRTAVGGGKIIGTEDIREKEDLLPAIWEFRKDRFHNALAEFDLNELKLSIRDMYSKAFYGLEEDTLLYYKLYICLIKEIWKYFYNIGICKDKVEDFLECYQEYYLAACEHGEYIKIIFDAINKIVEENQLSDKNNQVTPAIRIVKRYIAEHYQEEISLTSAAQRVHISPVYLSRLFKKEEGINFLDYLNQYRIDIAKGLLCDVRYNVIEVAEQSGFKNTRYFSKIFKKLVGITPSEYRKRHVEE